MKNTNCECCRTNSKVNWFSYLNDLLQMMLLVEDHFNPDGMDLHPIYAQLCKLIMHMCIFGI
jgi:hypothetical protein